MDFYISKNKIENIGDYLLSITSTIQSFIMIFQLVLIDGGFLPEETAAKVRIAMSALLVLLSCPWILKRNFRIMLQSLFLIIFIFAHSLIITPENIDSILSDGLKLTLCSCLPIFLCTASIKDVRIFYKSCTGISILCAIIGLLYGILFFTGNLPMMEKPYNMSYGYALLFPSMFFLYKKQLIYTIMAFILLILIVIIGSRGPLIPFIGFYIWLNFIKGRKSDRFKVLLLIIGVILSFPLILAIFSYYEINSRTLFFIVEGYMDSTSGRDSITDIIWQKILLQPILGYGVFADRIFMDGSYCHNILMELFLNFGLFIPLLFLLFFIPFIINLWKNLSYPENDLFILLGIASIFPLLLSSSYLIDFRIALFLGFIYKYRNKGLCVKANNKVSLIHSKSNFHIK